MDNLIVSKLNFTVGVALMLSITNMNNLIASVLYL
jgi:hypothetical protein